MWRNLVLLTLVVITTCGSSLKPWSYLAQSANDKHTIYIVNHGWHTGIVVPASVLGDKLDMITAYFDTSSYFELGWGDAGFYQAEQITPELAVKALLWPSDSVMHVVAMPTDPQTYFPQSEVIGLKLSTQAMEKLTAFIATTFAYSVNDRLIKMRPGLYGQSWFFVGAGSYHGLYTCNSWTADVLLSAGVPVDDWMTLTAASVMAQTRQALQAGGQ